MITDLFSGAQLFAPNISKSISIPPYSSVTEDFDLAVAPSFVSKVRIDATFSGIGLSGPTAISDFAYVTYETPVDLMANPWTEILDSTCAWAFGLYTEGPVMHSITFGLYHQGGNYYDGGPANYLGFAADDDWQVKGYFRLSSYVSADTPRTVDCRDAAGALKLMAESQGILGATHTLWYQHGQALLPNPFHTNILRPVGHSAWLQTSWVFHDVFVRGVLELVDESCAAYAYDPFGQVWNDVLSGHFKPTFWQNAQSGTMYGLVNGYWYDPTPSIPGDEQLMHNVPVPLSSHVSVVKFRPPGRDLRLLTRGVL